MKQMITFTALIGLFVFGSLSAQAQSSYNDGEGYGQPTYEQDQPNYQQSYETQSYQPVSSFYFKGALGNSYQSSNSFMGGDVEYAGSLLGAVSLSAGIDFSSRFMAEIELSSLHSSLDQVNGTQAEGELSSGMLALNGIFKIPFGIGYNFLLGGGIGALSAELTDDLTGNYADGSAYATQWILGFSGEINPNLEASFELRHIRSGEMELTGTSGAYQDDFNFRNTSALVGMKYNF